LISKLLLLILFSAPSWSFDKDLTTINERVPLEFNHLFDSLKLEIKKPSEKIRMIGLCKDLNDNLGFLQKEHIFMLMKTEVIKGTLEFRFDKVRQFDVNQMLILRMEKEYENKKGYLNPFSKWIWQSVLAELNHRKKMGLITAQSFNPGNFDGTKKSEAMRFQRYLNYLFPWIDKMDSLDAAAFNKIAKEVSWSILKRINERSILFKRYASTATGDTQVTIINIPQKLLDLKPEEIKRMQNDQAPLTLAEQAKKEKAQASQEIEKVTPLDMSTMSEDVANELEKKTAPPASSP
jgi:hypothetical protein